MSIDGTSFEVWYIDQVNEGRAVWAIYDDCCDTFEIARGIADEKARTSEYGQARVVEVTRRTVETIVENRT